MDLFDSDLKISTNHISLEHVSIDDAQKIFDLRINHKGSILKRINTNVAEQEAYLNKYFDRFKNFEEIYYSIKNVNANQVYGYVRLTELNNDFKFSYESLILKKSAPKVVSLDVILAIYKIGFELIAREICGPWVIPIEGERILKLHNKMGMISMLEKNKKYNICIVSKSNYKKKINFFEKLGLGTLIIN